jgi:hypothetical protein
MSENNFEILASTSTPTPTPTLNFTSTPTPTLTKTPVANFASYCLAQIGNDIDGDMPGMDSLKDTTIGKIAKEIIDDILETININRKKINGYWYFSFDIPTLKEIANKYKWICEYDDYEEEEEDSQDEGEDEIDYKASYEHLKLAFEELQSKNKKLKSKLKKLNIEK